MSNPELKEGDAVQWMEITQRRNGMDFKTRTGTIVGIGPTLAEVRFANGRRATVRRRMLRTMEEKSPVNDVFGALTASAEKGGKR